MQHIVDWRIRGTMLQFPEEFLLDGFKADFQMGAVELLEAGGETIQLPGEVA